MLTQLGHAQQPTLIKTDNATAFNFIHDNINQKKSKSWDMRLYWLRYRKEQQQFCFHWERGTNNKGDYFTKHHTEKHHRSIRSTYVHDRFASTNMIIPSHELQGCVRPLGHRPGHPGDMVILQLWLTSETD